MPKTDIHIWNIQTNRYIREYENTNIHTTERTNERTIQNCNANNGETKLYLPSSSAEQQQQQNQ